MNIKKMQEYLEAFAKEREWNQYRTPKNLSMALSVEAGELMEIFQWMSGEQSRLVRDDATYMQQIEEEMADVLSYLVQLATVLNIDLEEAFWKKTKKNLKKYPVPEAKDKKELLNALYKK